MLVFDGKKKFNFIPSQTFTVRWQECFRKNHSGDTCLSFLNDKILKCFDDGLLTGMILTDLHKAFDMINHDILLQKLSMIGFSDGTAKWF